MAYNPPAFRPMNTARAARCASTMRTLRAVASGLRQGAYGGPGWLNEQVARWYESEAADSHRKLQAFEAQGGFDRASGRRGGNR